MGELFKTLDPLTGYIIRTALINPFVVSYHSNEDGTPDFDRPYTSSEELVEVAKEIMSLIDANSSWIFHTDEKTIKSLLHEEYITEEKIRLLSGSWYRKSNLIRDIGNLNNPNLIPDLTYVLFEDESPTCRKEAAKTLKRMNAPQSLLVKALEKEFYNSTTENYYCRHEMIENLLDFKGIHHYIEQEIKDIIFEVDNLILEGFQRYVRTRIDLPKLFVHLIKTTGENPRMAEQFVLKGSYVLDSFGEAVERFYLNQKESILLIPYNQHQRNVL